MRLLKKHALFFTMLTLSCFTKVVLAADEQFDIKTYYPVSSPGSTYKEIILSSYNTTTPTCSGASDEGKVYYNATKKSVDVCVADGSGGYESNPAPGQKSDFWSGVGNNIYNNNTGWVLLKKSIIGNNNTTDIDLTINGAWAAYTNQAVYPLVNTASGTRWFGRYENYGFNAISTGAYNPNTFKYENFLINAFPDCCGFVGVGIRVPRAKLNVAYPGGAVNTIFQVDTENTLTGGSKVIGLLVDTGPYVHIGESKDGVKGRLTVNEEHFDASGSALSVYSGIVNIDSGGELLPGKVNMAWREYIGFYMYYNGNTDRWIQRGDSANNGAALIASNHSLGDLSFKVFARNNGADVPLNYPAYNNPNLYISPDNNVSVNTTNSMGLKFYVNGTASATGGNWQVPSDQKLKKDIKTIDNALKKINELRGVSFEWKEPGFGRPGPLLGLIAQETQRVVPEVVIKTDEYYGMENSALVALLVEATKDQQKQIDSLKLKLKQLKHQIKARI